VTSFSTVSVLPSAESVLFDVLKVFRSSSPTPSSDVVDALDRHGLGARFAGD
jgi:hypothetical protein